VCSPEECSGCCYRCSTSTTTTTTTNARAIDAIIIITAAAVDAGTTTAVIRGVRMSRTSTDISSFFHIPSARFRCEFVPRDHLRSI